LRQQGRTEARNVEIKYNWSGGETDRIQSSSIDGGEAPLWVMNRRADHWLP
jgi:hypothetical protein